MFQELQCGLNGLFSDLSLLSTAPLCFLLHLSVPVEQLLNRHLRRITKRLLSVMFVNNTSLLKSVWIYLPFSFLEKVFYIKLQSVSVS